MKGRMVVTSACNVAWRAIFVTFPHEIASLTNAPPLLNPILPPSLTP